MKTQVIGWDQEPTVDIVDYEAEVHIKVIVGFYGGNLDRIEIVKWSRSDEPIWIYQGICRDDEHRSEIFNLIR